MALLDIRDLVVRYGEIEALRGISLTVDAGQVVTLLGANGAGKSTTLRAISGLEKPAAGDILFDGKSIAGLGPEAIVRLGISHVPEGRRIFPGLTVKENIMLGASNRRVRKSELSREADAMFDLFPDIRKFSNSLGWTLSGGQLQMVAVARGLMAKPRLLLLDEPSLGLAPVIVQAVFRIISQIRQNTTVLLVEQNARMGLSVADHGYVLETGRIVGQRGHRGRLSRRPCQGQCLKRATFTLIEAKRETRSMANNLKTVWASGKVVVNAWLAIPSGFSAEVIAQCGFDSVTVDIQHGVQDYQSMVQCFQAMHGHPVTPMVRVPWNEPGIIGKVLDGGAYGVICPMINTRQEAENLVQYSKYPPLGVRSNGAIRSGMCGSAGTYPKTDNEEIVLLPMMETKTAIGNMEAILDVEGINGVYIGPSDLGFSYGLVPKLDRDEPEILKIYEKIVKECGKRGLYPGIHCSGADGAVRAINMGFKLVTLSNESGLMMTYAKMQIAQTRKDSGGKA